MTGRRWDWSDSDGVNRVWEEIEKDGFTWFRDPHAVCKAQDPLAFCESLFGMRPIRFQKMLIEPSLKGNQQTLPKTMFAGTLHNDCAQLGMPPHVQVMVCERQASQGGGSIVLDLWPVLANIQSQDLELYRQLFTVPRLLASGHAPRAGLTWSLCRGNLICVHPASTFDRPVGAAFQRYIDAANKDTFRCEPGDVYINNNHRCLHGREGFMDPGRRFIRYLYWFARPLAAPPQYIEAAAQGTAALADKLRHESFWIQQLFGVEAPENAPGHQHALEHAVDSLQRPTDSNLWQGANHRQIRVQEAMLSAAWRTLNEPDVAKDTMLDQLLDLINTHAGDVLQQCSDAHPDVPTPALQPAPAGTLLA